MSNRLECEGKLIVPSYPCPREDHFEITRANGTVERHVVRIGWLEKDAKYVIAALHTGDSIRQVAMYGI